MPAIPSKILKLVFLLALGTSTLLPIQAASNSPLWRVNAQTLNPNLLRVNALTLNSGEGRAFSAVIDSIAGFAYFGTYTNPAVIVKVRLSDLSRIGNLTISPMRGGICSGALDSMAGYAYFGTCSTPGVVYKVNLQSFTIASVLTLNAREGLLASAVLDSAGGFLYFGTSVNGFAPPMLPDNVVKIRLSDFTRVGNLTLAAGESSLFTAVLDSTNGYAYFGTRTSPGIVVKIRLSDFTRAGALALSGGENMLRSSVIDYSQGFGYFGTETSPGIVVKVHLSDLTRVAGLTLNIGENSTQSAILDPDSESAFFSTFTIPGAIVKIRLSDFTNVGSLTLNKGENQVAASVIDPVGFAYLSTFTLPTIVVKVQVAFPPSEPGTPSIRLGVQNATLNWAPPSFNGEHPIAGYKLYRSTTPAGETQVGSTVTTLGNITTYTDIGLLSGTTYYYQVSALNNVGESIRSGEVGGVPLAPAAPSIQSPPIPLAIITLAFAAGSLTTLALSVVAIRVMKQRRPG